MEPPEIRYARTAGEVHVAYQVAGDGSMDLVVVATGLGLSTIWAARRPSPFPEAFYANAEL